MPVITAEHAVSMTVQSRADLVVCHSFAVLACGVHIIVLQLPSCTRVVLDVSCAQYKCYTCYTCVNLPK